MHQVVFKFFLEALEEVQIKEIGEHHHDLKAEKIDSSFLNCPIIWQTQQGILIKISKKKSILYFI